MAAGSALFPAMMQDEVQRWVLNRVKFPHFTPTPLCRVLLHHHNTAKAPGPPMQVWDSEEGFAGTTMLSPWLSAGMRSSQALHTLSNFYSSKLDKPVVFLPHALSFLQASLLHSLL